MANQKSSRTNQPHEKRAPKQDPQGKRQSGRQQEDQKMNDNSSRREDVDIEDGSSSSSNRGSKRR